MQLYNYNETEEYFLMMSFTSRKYWYLVWMFRMLERSLFLGMVYQREFNQNS